MMSAELAGEITAESKEQLEQTELAQAVSLVCAELESRGQHELASTLRATLEGNTTAAKRGIDSFVFDESPEEVSREAYLRSYTRLKNMVDQYADPYQCYDRFTKWLESLLLDPANRINRLKNMKISNIALGNVDFSGSVFLVATDVIRNLRTFQPDFTKLLVTFYSEQQIENEALALDIRVVQKYCAQQGWWK